MKQKLIFFLFSAMLLINTSCKNNSSPEYITGYVTEITSGIERDLKAVNVQPANEIELKTANQELFYHLTLTPEASVYVKKEMLINNRYVILKRNSSLQYDIKSD